MNIGLYDVDSHNYPNLPLMKISAWHKAQGDNVEFVVPLCHYDKIYVSKVFGDEYSAMTKFCLQADEVIYGGTGFAITVKNGKEVYHKDKDGTYLSDKNIDKFVQKHKDDKNYKFERLWKPNKDGLGMAHCIDEINKIYGKDFIKY